MAQFMNDIRFAFEEVKWLPGKYECIERSESKPYMLSKAKEIGLEAPDLTINSATYPDLTMKEFYKKNLGPPFIVSVNRQIGKEVAMVTTNILVTAHDYIPDGDMWQWQTAIPSSHQIRCFIVGHNIWAAICSRTDHCQDLRQASDVNKENIEWKPFSLPLDAKSKIFALMDVLKIRIAAPEFLFNPIEKKLTFIDLNPCGDWYGFFGPESYDEIITALVTEINS